MGLRVEAFEPGANELVDSARTASEHTVRWQGPAELIDPSGLVIAEVAAELWKLTLEGRGPRWGGELRISIETGLTDPAGEASPHALRLPGGGVGSIGSLGAIRLGAGLDPAHTAQFAGQGEPPF